MPVALPALEIAVLVVALLALALALLITNILKAVASQIPSPLGVFDWLKNGIYSVASAIANVLGKAEAGVDSAIGASWHALAWFMRSWWHEIERQALGYANLAQLVARLVYAHSGLKAIVHHLERVWHGIEHGIRTIERKLHGIEGRVRTLERTISHGIGADVLPRLRTLERDVATIDGKAIPAIRAEEAALQNDITQLGEYVRANFLSSATGAITAAVAVALAALGLSGLRCNTLLNSLKNRGCGLWQGLEDLLGLFLDAVIFTNLCQLTGWINQLFAPIEGLVVQLISDAANAACAQRPAGYVYPSASVPTSTLPPPQQLGATP